MNIKNYRKKLILIALFPLGMLLYLLTTRMPGVIEYVFSRGLNKWFTEALSLFTGLAPFSAAEFGLIILTVLALYLIITGIINVIRAKTGKLKLLLDYILNVLAAVSVVYFILTVTWTLNYNRFPYAKIAGLDVRPASVAELSEVCDGLISRANSLRGLVRQDSNGVMALSASIPETFGEAKDGYEVASKTNPTLSGTYGRPKPVFFSEKMSYSGIVGIYCPFTCEVNVDVAISDYSIPSTVCHEMAHQHGFAREDEANYISYVTCSLNPNADFQYSGTMLALISSMNALYSHDKDRFNDLNKKISEDVHRDMKADALYWQKHKGPVQKTVTSINDAYLKANRQTDGVYSYGRMIDLLIAQYRRDHSVVPSVP